jgi:hypothetical protein
MGQGGKSLQKNTAARAQIVTFNRYKKPLRQERALAGLASPASLQMMRCDPFIWAERMA